MLLDRPSDEQLWANLPAADKMMEPRYRGIKNAEIPTATDAGGATVRVIAGTVAGVAELEKGTFIQER